MNCSTCSNATCRCSRSVTESFDLSVLSKTIPSAVDQGFGRAFITIIDTHVTTIISSLFLFVFGTGPIRGFAVTLSIGLIANLFTSTFVSKTLFELVLSRRSTTKTLSI